MQQVGRQHVTGGNHTSKNAQVRGGETGPDQEDAEIDRMANETVGTPGDQPVLRLHIVPWPYVRERKEGPDLHGQSQQTQDGAHTGYDGH